MSQPSVNHSCTIEFEDRYIVVVDLPGCAKTSIAIVSQVNNFEINAVREIPSCILFNGDAYDKYNEFNEGSSTPYCGAFDDVSTSTINYKPYFEFNNKYNYIRYTICTPNTLDTLNIIYSKYSRGVLTIHFGKKEANCNRRYLFQTDGNVNDSEQPVNKKMRRK